MNDQHNTWSFTWNNYELNRVKDLHYNKLRSKAAWWIMQQEKGAQGTPHMQGAIRFKKKVSLNYLKQVLPHAHWDKIESDEQIDYCNKLETLDGDQFRYGQVPLEFRGQGILEPQALYTWQAELEKELLGPVNDRKIIWICGKNGNEGKTAFVKYMNWYHSYQFVTGGKTGDIGESLKDWLSSAKGVIVDYPRNMDPEEYCYDTLEMFKNGMMSLTKYKSVNRSFTSKHLVVFSNHLPKLDAMSEDRWDVRMLEGRNFRRPTDNDFATDVVEKDEESGETIEDNPETSPIIDIVTPMKKKRVILTDPSTPAKKVKCTPFSDDEEAFQKEFFESDFSMD